MEKENIIIPMEQLIKVIGQMISNMGKENKYGLIVQFMKDNIDMAKNKEREFIFGLMELNIQEIGIIINSMALLIKQG